MTDKWTARFLALADHVAAWSKDSTQVGAVIVRPDRTIASLGFNGLARGVVDEPARLAERDTKLGMTVHAEMNAVLSAHEPVRGMTLFCTMPVCGRCAAHVIQSGIVRVITRHVEAPRWEQSFIMARLMFAEAGVAVTSVKNGGINDAGSTT